MVNGLSIGGDRVENESAGSLFTTHSIVCDYTLLMWIKIKQKVETFLKISSLLALQQGTFFSSNNNRREKPDIKSGMQQPLANIIHGSGYQRQI